MEDSNSIAQTDASVSDVSQNNRRTGPEGFVRAVIEIWALAGGGVLLAILLMTTASVISDAVANKPIAGDFELVKLGMAVAAFAFLPYAQLTHANVTVDIFTTWASPRLIALMSFFSSLIALTFSLVLLWRMELGMMDYLHYKEFTPIVSFPIWMVFPPILVSLALLAIASSVTALEAFHSIRK